MKFIKVRPSDNVIVERMSCTTFPPENTGDWILVPRFPPTKDSYRFVKGEYELFTPEVTARDILNVRAAEFAWTELGGQGMPDRPFPQELLDYRQALRDITADGREVGKLIDRFPKRPDGTDPIEKWRQ